MNYEDESLFGRGERPVFDAIKPIAASLVAQLGFVSKKAIADLTSALAYCGMLVAETPENLDDERYPEASEEVVGCIVDERTLRDDFGFKVLEDIEEPAAMRDHLQLVLKESIRAIQTAGWKP